MARELRLNRPCSEVPTVQLSTAIMFEWFQGSRGYDWNPATRPFVQTSSAPNGGAAYKLNCRNQPWSSRRWSAG